MDLAFLSSEIRNWPNDCRFDVIGKDYVHILHGIIPISLIPLPVCFCSAASSMSILTACLHCVQSGLVYYYDFGPWLSSGNGGSPHQAR